jgi:hypothetical protein
MKPCWIEVTILASGEKELRNLAVFETIRTAEDGAPEIWKDGRCALVQESPAQIMALIREASK